jgi:hypothetical protein
MKTLERKKKTFEFFKIKIKEHVSLCKIGNWNRKCHCIPHIVWRCIHAHGNYMICKFSGLVALDLTPVVATLWIIELPWAWVPLHSAIYQKKIGKPLQYINMKAMKTRALSTSVIPNT